MQLKQYNLTGNGKKRKYPQLLRKGSETLPKDKRKPNNKQGERNRKVNTIKMSKEKTTSPTLKFPQEERGNPSSSVLLPRHHQARHCRLHPNPVRLCCFSRVFYIFLGNPLVVFRGPTFPFDQEVVFTFYHFLIAYFDSFHRQEVL